MLDGRLESARGGRSGALLVRGESGIGKTALLDYAIESGSDLRLLHAVGVESEIELAFATLHQLCAPLLDRLDVLPGPQRDAVRSRLGCAPAPCQTDFSRGWRCSVPARLDERVADQLVAEGQGNPLALSELPRVLDPAQLAGGFGLPEALSVPRRIEESFLQRNLLDN